MGEVPVRHRRGRAAAPEPELDPGEAEQAEQGLEIEVAPPGKSTKRLSLLSGGEKSQDVSMRSDGISRVVSRKLAGQGVEEAA